MKKLIALFSLGIITYLPLKGQEMIYTSTVDIEKQKTTNTITKEHEILVTHDEDYYVIQFNIKHGGKVKTHKASVESDKHFDKASYSWVSKNRVAIKLFSLNSTDEYELKVSGKNKHTTGMEVEAEAVDKPK